MQSFTGMIQGNRETNHEPPWITSWLGHARNSKRRPSASCRSKTPFARPKQNHTYTSNHDQALEPAPVPAPHESDRCRDVPYSRRFAVVTWNPSRGRPPPPSGRPGTRSRVRSYGWRSRRAAPAAATAVDPHRSSQHMRNDHSSPGGGGRGGVRERRWLPGVGCNPGLQRASFPPPRR